MQTDELWKRFAKYKIVPVRWGYDLYKRVEKLRWNWYYDVKWMWIDFHYTKEKLIKIIQNDIEERKHLQSPTFYFDENGNEINAKPSKENEN